MIRGILALLFWVQSHGTPVPDQARAPRIPALIEAGEYARAEKRLRALIARKPVPAYQFLLGLCLKNSFRYEEAEEWLGKALVAFPDRHVWLNHLAECQLERRRYIEAAATLARALALAERPLYHYNKAMALLNAGRVEDAEGELLAALASDSEYFMALLKVGGIYLELGRPAEAAEKLRSAVRLNPVHAETHFKLGQALRDSGEAEEAVRQFKRVLTVFPEHMGANYHLGRLLATRGLTAEARPYLERFHDLAELEELIQNHRQFIQTDPRDADLRMALAGLLLRAGRAEEALTQMRAARVLAPGRRDVLAPLARTLRRLCLEEEAARLEGALAAAEGTTP